MRIVSVAAAVAAAFTIGLAAPVSAASVDDLVNLRANGLSEDLLIALVETDGSSFDLSTEDVLTLHRRGLGDRLIAAMLKTAPRRSGQPSVRHDGRTGLPGGVNHPAASAVVGAPAGVVAAPAVVAASTVVVAPAAVVQEPALVVAAPIVVVSPPAAPVQPYWGFGGRPRPGSWDPR